MSEKSSSAPLPNRDELIKIVQVGNGDSIVHHGLNLGNWLAIHLSTSQIRNFFTTVRQIEAAWPVPPTIDDDVKLSEEERAEIAKSIQYSARQLVLLKPKLAYQASREQRGGTGMAALRDLLTDAIDLVGDNREYFQNFTEFFEAILAYHAAGSESLRRQI